MHKHNPFEPPSSDVELAQRPRESIALLVTGALALLWVVLSPIMWWHNLSQRFGFQPELSLMVQPLALSFIGLAGVPFLWRRSLDAGIVIVVLSAATAASVLWHAPMVSDGVLINAFALSFVSLLSWLRARKASVATRDA